MKHLPFVCAALLAAALVAQEPAKPQAPAAAPTVGTIDLLRVFEQNPRWAKAKGELGRLQEQFKTQLGKVDDRIAELKALAESSAEDSEERRAVVFEREMALRQREFLAKQATERLELEEARAMLVVYQDIETAIGQVAKARGVGVVQRLQAIGPVPGEIGKVAPKEVQARLVAFERKIVWYAAPELDLTDDLIKALMAPVGDKPAGAQEASARPGGGKPAAEKAPADKTPKAGG